MRKCRWLILSLALLLAAALAAGCGGKPQESQKEEAKEEDKLQIGLSFDSFVIERWLRDRDMFVSTARALGRSECAGSRRRCGRADFPDRVFLLRKR